MVKFCFVVVVLVVVGVCATEAARLRNSKFFARQEVQQEQDVPAQTPYPPAGIVPEVRFNLPNEPAQPQEQEQEEEQEPEKTYLPPDNLQPPAQTYGPPAQTYGPPELEGSGNDAVADYDDVPQQSEDDQANELETDSVSVNAEANKEFVDPQLQRFVAAKNLRRQSIKPAKLRAAPLPVIPAARLRSQRLIAQPIYSTNGALIAYRMLRV